MNNIHDNYIKFIEESMSLMINKVIRPFSITYDPIVKIIDRYSYMKKKARSPKLNYEVLEKLGISVE